ncbi:hypothetical protein [Aquibacillus kalidii]|uniref:hypothetical protein n=1 Tax=Aquibacillus kalidii TaxID=2762597 RepID=UPI001645C090|nr:hypothetical protein [Aquibacillus kalidii]
MRKFRIFLMLVASTLILLIISYDRTVVFSVNNANDKTILISGSEKRELEKILLEKLDGYDVVVSVFQNYLQNKGIIAINTSFTDTSKEAKLIAEDIKKDVEKVLETNMPRISYSVHVINQDREDLINNVNKSLEEDIENYGKKLTNKIGKNYSLNNAVKNGDIITNNNISSVEQKKINNFVRNIRNNNSDFIRFVNFNTKKVTELQFNGKLIYYSQKRITDQDMIAKGDETDSNVISDYCKEIVLDSEMSYLTNCYNNELIEF